MPKQPHVDLPDDQATDVMNDWQPLQDDDTGEQRSIGQLEENGFKRLHCWRKGDEVWVRVTSESDGPFWLVAKRGR